MLVAMSEYKLFYLTEDWKTLKVPSSPMIVCYKSLCPNYRSKVKMHRGILWQIVTGYKYNIPKGYNDTKVEEYSSLELQYRKLLSQKIG